MDNPEMITKVKSVLLEGDSVKETTIAFYVDLVKGLVKSRCGATEYPQEMNYITIDVVVGYINRRGKEGFSQASEGEVNQTILGNLLQPYGEDFAAYIKRHRTGKLRFI